MQYNDHYVRTQYVPLHHTENITIGFDPDLTYSEKNYDNFS